MNRIILYLTLLLTASLLPWQRCNAQEQEVLDYRDFKFYEERTDEDISLWGGMNDTLFREKMGRHYTPHSRYALSYASSSYRGERLSKSRALVGFTTIDYTTLRTLKSLGYSVNEACGIMHSHRSASTGQTSTILTDYLPNDRQSIYADFSCRNYLLGISHRGIYSLNKYGVPLKEGWRILDYARVRTGRDLYVDGVFTNSVDIAVGASYKGRNDKLDLVVALPWSERGLRQASTDEAFTLTHNTMYNPAWGMQKGKVRNSRVATSLRPEILALWQRRLSATTDLTLAANLFFERRGTSALTWFDVTTPAPDNYKYMPSYYDDDDRIEVERSWTTNDLRYTQIDWDRLYLTNSIQQDGAARYAVSQRRTNHSNLSINVGFRSTIGIATLHYGAELKGVGNRQFRVMSDLLGATHIRDIDYFISDDVTYSHLTDNNLRNPDDIIHEGDRYDYDYRTSRIGVKFYATAEWSIADFDFIVGAQMTPERIWRRGFFEKELFAGNASFGHSKSTTLTPAMINASCRYTLNNHILTAALMLSSNSPDEEDIFLQPQYNNRLADNIKLSNTLSAELSYTYITKRLRLDASLYLNSTTREMDVVRYYDDLSGEYADAVVSGIGRIHYGIEATAEASWSRLFSSTFTLNMAQYRFHRNPTVTTYTDDDNTLFATSVSNMRGHHVGAPEIALYGDICFRYNGWMARASVQYWALAYASPSILRRTERILSYAASKECREALDIQQQLPGNATIDLTLTKYFNLKDNTSIGIQLSARNILSSNIVYSAYEENRISLHRRVGYTNVRPFANRLTYAYPRLFSLSVSLRF